MLNDIDHDDSCTFLCPVQSPFHEAHNVVAGEGFVVDTDAEIRFPLSGIDLLFCRVEE